MEFTSYLVLYLLSLTAIYNYHGTVKLPDHQFTPGQIVTTDGTKVCTRGYAATQRHTSNELKLQVYHEYAQVNSKAKPFEIDHLISLELGGADSTKNLWPQPYYEHPGAHEKDVLENELHREVCNHTITLDSAQKLIAGDWYQVYLAKVKH